MAATLNLSGKVTLHVGHSVLTATSRGRGGHPGIEAIDDDSGIMSHGCTSWVVALGDGTSKVEALMVSLHWVSRYQWHVMPKAASLRGAACRCGRQP